MLATPAWAMAIPFRENSFVMLVPLRILPASFVYAYQHLLRCGTTVPTLHTMPISHFPLGLRFCVGLQTHVLIQFFCSRFQSRHSLPLHSHGGLGPPSSYPWQFCRFIYFGFRLVRAGFGYAESAFSVFGLSKLGSAMPNRS